MCRSAADRRPRGGSTRLRRARLHITPDERRRWRDVPRSRSSAWTRRTQSEQLVGAPFHALGRPQWAPCRSRLRPCDARKARNDRMNHDLNLVRSVLFLPASNPRAITKARESAADLVILDLEDAVKPGDKTEARAAAVDAVTSDWRMPVAIRINGVGTEWHSLDLDAVARSKTDVAVVPRAA